MHWMYEIMQVIGISSGMGHWMGNLNLGFHAICVRHSVDVKIIILNDKRIDLLIYILMRIN